MISHTKHWNFGFGRLGGGGGGLRDSALVGEVWTTNDIIQAAENSGQEHDRVVEHKEVRERVLVAASPLHTEKVPLGYSKELFDIFKDLPKVFMKVRFLKDFENLLSDNMQLLQCLSFGSSR